MTFSQQTDQILQKICNELKNLSDVRAVYLFGSRAKKKDRLDSDVDLLIDLDKDSDVLNVRDRMRLIYRSLDIAESLQEVVRVKIDVLEMHEISTMKTKSDVRRSKNTHEIADSIEKDMVKIYER